MRLGPTASREVLLESANRSSSAVSWAPATLENPPSPPAAGARVLPGLKRADLLRALTAVMLLAMPGCYERTVHLVRDPILGDSGTVRSDAAADTALPVPDAATTPDTGSDAARVDAGSAPDGSAPHQPSARCGSQPCACDDGLDNDADGLTDGLDPECTGSFDADEATFGIGKANKQNQCRDCFWDDNAGFGDDGCRYPAECLAGTAPNSRGSCSSCKVSQNCLDSCGARTPNGCDCFGCCQVQRGSDRVYIELSESCDLSRLDDPSVCPPCVPSTQCANPCGRCELCLGRRPSDLPADCAASAPGSPAYDCEDGLKVCAASSDCVGASYCLLGCCLIDLF